MENLKKLKKDIIVVKKESQKIKNIMKQIKKKKRNTPKNITNKKIKCEIWNPEIKN